MDGGDGRKGNRTAVLHKMFPESDISCWRCKQDKGDFLNIYGGSVRGYGYFGRRSMKKLF